MPKRNADSPLERAVGALDAALKSTGAPFMVIGGLAVIAHGVRRLTTDVDAVVEGTAVDLKVLVRALAAFEITPRIAHAQRFARANLVLLLRHAPSGVDLDVSLGFTQFELEALRARKRVRFGAVSTPMARPEDLVIFKVLAARPKDVGDATTLLALHPKIDLDRVRSRVTALAALADAPELVQVLDAIVAAAAAVRTKRPARRTPRSQRRR